MTDENERPVLSVENLTMQYRTCGGIVRAVDGVSFQLARCQVLGLVGESGSGKTSVANSLLKLLPENGEITNGSIVLDGTDLVPLSEDEVRAFRWDRISMIFQAAMNSLDPVYRVGDQVLEALELHVRSSRKVSDVRVRELYDLVGLNHEYIPRYPHEYSGGMKQRAVIAMALACDPAVVVADEPTTALDVIVQDRILRELKAIQARMGMSMVYISHDMAVIAEVSESMAVMYAGRIVEYGATPDVFARPIHPYTEALMAAFPNITGDKKELGTLAGEPPGLIDPPAGCRFHPRCPYATEECGRDEPPIVGRSGHWAACRNPLPESLELER